MEGDTMYTECKIEELVEQLEINKAKGKKCVLIIGAGVSASAGIPLAHEIIEIIKNTYPEKCFRSNPKTYTDYMKVISPSERKDLINSFIEKSNLNIAHLYMAQLIKMGYVDRVLTTNFDTLLSQALASENIFPGIYDFATSQVFKASDTAAISLFHLHGQKDGYELLHTDKEVDKIFQSSKDLFEDTIGKRTVIVIGYSGENDPVFRHLESIEEFGHYLYWISFKNEEPSEKILKNILDKDNYSFLIKGYTADTFFVELANLLNIDGPSILQKPFTNLLERVSNIAIYESQDNKIDLTSETKKWIKGAIEEFEKVELSNLTKNENEIVQNNEILFKLLKDSYMKKNRANDSILREHINKDSNMEIKLLYVKYLVDWSRDIGRVIETNKKNTEISKLLLSFEELKNRIDEIEIQKTSYFFEWALLFESLINCYPDDKKVELAEKVVVDLNNTINEYSKPIRFENELNYYTTILQYTVYLSDDEKKKYIFHSIDFIKNNLDNLRASEHDLVNYSAIVLKLTLGLDQKDEKKILNELLLIMKVKENDIESIHYNLACVCSRLMKYNEAISYLRMSVNSKDAPPKAFILEDVDLKNIRIMDEFKEIVNTAIEI